MDYSIKILDKMHSSYECQIDPIRLAREYLHSNGAVCVCQSGPQTRGPECETWLAETGEMVLYIQDHLLGLTYFVYWNDHKDVVETWLADLEFCTIGFEIENSLYFLDAQSHFDRDSGMMSDQAFFYINNLYRLSILSTEADERLCRYMKKSLFFFDKRIRFAALVSLYYLRWKETVEFIEEMLVHETEDGLKKLASIILNDSSHWGARQIKHLLTPVHWEEIAHLSSSFSPHNTSLIERIQSAKVFANNEFSDSDIPF